MAGMSFDTIRVGHNYRLTNYGEVNEFEVISRLSTLNYSIKDLHTLEVYEIEDLIRYGKGKDFDLEEIR